jgi:hypothetical protein
MVLIDFCFQRFGESKFEFTTDEFRAFAEAQGWWTRESNGPFSDQFPMRCFSRYQRGKQSSIRLIDKTPFGTWRLPRRLWNDLSWFLKVTRTPSGPSYSCAISINPGPEGWGDYARRK